MTLTPEQRAELLAKRDRATAVWQESVFVDGPRYRMKSPEWKQRMVAIERLIVRGPGAVGTGACNPIGSFERQEDRDYAVAACNAVPDLIADLEAAEARIAQLEQQIKDLTQ